MALRLTFCVNFLGMKYYSIIQWYYLNEQAIETEISSYRERPINFTVTLSVKVNVPMILRLDNVAEFKMKKPGTLAREILLEGIEKIERDPYFKKFMRDKAANKAKEARLTRKERGRQEKAAL